MYAKSNSTTITAATATHRLPINHLTTNHQPLSSLQLISLAVSF